MFNFYGTPISNVSSRLFPEKNRSPEKKEKENQSNCNDVAKNLFSEIEQSKRKDPSDLRQTPSKKVKQMPSSPILMPKPDFFPNTSPVSKQPPPPPRKVAPSKGRNENGQMQMQKYLAAQEMIEHAPENYEFLGRGCYKDAYKRQDGHVIKLYQKSLMKDKGRLFDKWTDYSFRQFQESKAMDIPCVEIYNNPARDGFFDMEFVPHDLLEACPLLGKKEPYTEKELKEIEPFLERIAFIFIQAIQHQIPLDLLTDNIRVRGDKKSVCLIDFREETEQGEEETYSVLVSAIRKLEMDPERGEATGVKKDNNTFATKMPIFTHHLVERIRKGIGPEHCFNSKYYLGAFEL